MTIENKILLVFGADRVKALDENNPIDKLFLDAMRYNVRRNGNNEMTQRELLTLLTKIDHRIAYKKGEYIKRGAKICQL